MNFKTLKPSYLFYKIEEVVFRKLNKDQPWLTKPAIHFLDTWLKETDRGWEWGSGRSTQWFAGKSAHITSIEHEKVWFDIVSEKIKDDKYLGKITYELHELASDSYENSILRIEDETLDFVLVDGRKRYECITNAISKVKPGGLLILDNSDRYIPMNIIGQRSTRHPDLNDEPKLEEKWAKVKEELSGWRMAFTTNHVWDTIIWVKPWK